MSVLWIMGVDTSRIDGPLSKEMKRQGWKEEEIKLHDTPQGASNIDYTKESERAMRTFDTGATRDSEDGKLDFDGFLSPLVIRRYAEYLHKHRTQADGQKRDSDNWQKGIPLTTYMKSMWRHFVDLWTMHRFPGGELQCSDSTEEEALCAIIFNASGYLHEYLKVSLVDVAPLDAVSEDYIDNTNSENC